MDFINRLLHQEWGDRMCAGSNENGQEEQLRMRRCVAQKPEVCKTHPILISMFYCCTVFLTTFIIPPDSCAQGGLTIFLALLALLVVLYFSLLLLSLRFLVSKGFP